MPENIILVVERMFDQSGAELVHAWTEPGQMARWRGSPGWHVERETVTSELRLGGRASPRQGPRRRSVGAGHHRRVVHRFFDPDVFVACQTISGDPGIDPGTPLELRVVKTGRDGTLVRIIPGPYDEAVAHTHSQGWERELTRLQA